MAQGIRGDFGRSRTLVHRPERILQRGIQSLAALVPVPIKLGATWQSCRNTIRGTIRVGRSSSESTITKTHHPSTLPGVTRVQAVGPALAGLLGVGLQ